MSKWCLCNQLAEYIITNYDYPSLKIIVELNNENKDKIIFFSESQGNENIPWAVTIKGETYTINSKTPFDALKKLDPYLKRDVMQRLIKEGTNF